MNQTRTGQAVLNDAIGCVSCNKKEDKKHKLETSLKYYEIQYCAKVLGIPLFASHVKANI